MSAVPLQGGLRELVMSLADVVSYSSTDPTVAQDLRLFEYGTVAPSYIM